MPPIRNITITPTQFSFTDKSGVAKTFVYSALPATQDTPAKAETFINTWCAANISDYQMVVHVFSISPVQLTVWTGNLGVTIPANWWVDG